MHGIQDVSIGDLAALLERATQPKLDLDTVNASWLRPGPGNWESAHEIVSVLCLNPDMGKRAYVAIATHGTRLTPTQLRGIASMPILAGYDIEQDTLHGMADTAGLPMDSRSRFAAGWVAEHTFSAASGTDYDNLLAIVCTALNLRAIGHGLPDGVIHVCGSHGPLSPQCLVAQAVIAYFAEPEDTTNSPESSQESAEAGTVAPPKLAATDPSADGQPGVEHEGLTASPQVSGTPQYSTPVAA